VWFLGIFEIFKRQTLTYSEQKNRWRAYISAGILKGWMDASSRGSSKIARNWRGLCPAVNCTGLMMMMMMVLKG
jgi:hypothetical protein